MEYGQFAFVFHEVDVDIPLDFAEYGPRLVIPVGEWHEVGPPEQDLVLLVFVLDLLVFGFVRILRGIHGILVHLREHVVCFGESTVFNVQKINICDLNQMITYQAQLFHVTRCKKVLFDDIICLAFFYVFFVERLRGYRAWNFIFTLDN